MKLVRKYLCLLLAVLLLVLCGCSQKPPAVLENQQYAIRDTGEELYLDFADNTYRDKATSNGVNASMGVYKITFPTVAKMKECIEKGQFTEAQLVGMQMFDRTDKGYVKVCDTNKLYEVVAPEGGKVTEILWKGANYEFAFTGPNFSGRIYIRGGESFELERTHYGEAEWGPLFTEVSRSRDESKNADVVYYTVVKSPDMGLRKNVSYTYEEPGLEIHFTEVYGVEDSETVPEIVYLWGYCQGQPFHGSISTFTGAPDYDVLTSIRVVPYVETEVA